MGTIDSVKQNQREFTKAYGLYQTSAWTLAILFIMVATLYRHHQDTIGAAQREARNYYRLNLQYRAWNASVGGVYVSTDKMAPNPYLSVPDRDITAIDGHRYTLVNPAYMTRVVFDSLRKSSQTPVISKLVSLAPLNPDNAPDEWERKALIAFEGHQITERSQVVVLDGKRYLRLISRFVTEDDCLKCHGQQGYKKGDIRGAISIAVPLSDYYAAESNIRTYMACGYLLLWLVGSVGITVASLRRYRHEASIKNSENKFRTVCDWMQDWEYWIDPSGVILYLSPSCEQISGYAPADFIKDPDLIRRIVHPLDWSAYEDHLELNLREGNLQPMELEFRIVTREGAVRWINHRCRAVFDNNGCYRGRRISHRDITEHKSLEEQLRHAQKMDAIGQLAGGIAHDFNNILMVIHGFTTMALMKMKPGDPQKEGIEQILAASERAAKLTHGLLAFSRKQEMRLTPVDLNGIIRNVEKFLKRIIGEDITFTALFNDDALKVSADGSQIEQILINLAANARDAMPYGGELILSTDTIELDEAFVNAHGYGEPGRYALLTVTDTGRGMDEQTREKIFEPFFTTKETGKGTGLGLAIVFGIVRQHNGQIEVTSAPGIGTTFRILLPLLTAKSINVQLPIFEPPLGGSETILVAEDDPAVRNLITTVLGEYGYEVITAADGQEAIDLCRVKGEKIRLVLMDVVMPGKSGMNALDEIKERLPGIKVLFTSGYPVDTPQSRSVLGEGRELLTKPVIPSHLARKVREILDAP